VPPFFLSVEKKEEVQGKGWLSLYPDRETSYSEKFIFALRILFDSEKTEGTEGSWGPGDLRESGDVKSSRY